MDVEATGRVAMGFFDVAPFEVVAAPGLGVAVKTAVFGRQGNIRRCLLDADRHLGSVRYKPKLPVH